MSLFLKREYEQEERGVNKSVTSLLFKVINPMKEYIYNAVIVVKIISFANAKLMMGPTTSPLEERL